jgi:hypothetical protein
VLSFHAHPQPVTPGAVPPLLLCFHPAEEQTHAVLSLFCYPGASPVCYCPFLWPFLLLFFHSKDIWQPVLVKEFSFMFSVLMHNLITICGQGDSAFFKKVHTSLSLYCVWKRWLFHLLLSMSALLWISFLFPCGFTEDCFPFLWSVFISTFIL